MGPRGSWEVLCSQYDGEDGVGRCVYGGARRMGLEDKAWHFKLGCCIKEYNTSHAAGLRWGGRKEEPPHSYSCSKLGIPCELGVLVGTPGKTELKLFYCDSI